MSIYISWSWVTFYYSLSLLLVIFCLFSSEQFLEMPSSIGYWSWVCLNEARVTYMQSPSEASLTALGPESIVDWGSVYDRSMANLPTILLYPRKCVMSKFDNADWWCPRCPVLRLVSPFLTPPILFPGGRHLTDACGILVLTILVGWVGVGGGRSAVWGRRGGKGTCSVPFSRSCSNKMIISF